jgi:hypothetical protein
MRCSIFTKRNPLSYECGEKLGTDSRACLDGNGIFMSLRNGLILVRAQRAQRWQAMSASLPNALVRFSQSLIFFTVRYVRGFLAVSFWLLAVGSWLLASARCGIFTKRNPLTYVRGSFCLIHRWVPGRRGRYQAFALRWRLRSRRRRDPFVRWCGLFRCGSLRGR